LRPSSSPTCMSLARSAGTHTSRPSTSRRSTSALVDLVVAGAGARDPFDNVAFLVAGALSPRSIPREPRRLGVSPRGEKFDRSLPAPRISRSGRRTTSSATSAGTPTGTGATSSRAPTGSTQAFGQTPVLAPASVVWGDHRGVGCKISGRISRCRRQGLRVSGDHRGVVARFRGESRAAGARVCGCRVTTGVVARFRGESQHCRVRLERVG
jgi:hypothetical protein